MLIHIMSDRLFAGLITRRVERESGRTEEVIGSMLDFEEHPWIGDPTVTGVSYILPVKWDITLPIDDDEEIIVYVKETTDSTFYSRSLQVDMVQTETGMFSVTNEQEQKDVSISYALNKVYNGEPILAFINDTHWDDDHKKVYERLSKVLRNAPVYNKIITIKDGEPILQNLITWWFDQPNEAQNTQTLITSLTSHNALERTVRSLLHSSDGFNLPTQEAQIDAYLSFSRLMKNDMNEYVSKQDIENYQQSEAYKQSIKQLTEKGFGLSKTQQHNVLQSIGYFMSSLYEDTYGTHFNQLFNLSDMGAGKTLMTVQSIYVMDLLLSEVFQDRYLTSNIYLPDKHIIAPELSIESSWIDTFRLFYQVEKKTEKETYYYLLTFEKEGRTYYSRIYVSPFTVTTNGLSVVQKLPTPLDTDYLIIDEIHQLSDRPIRTARFFEDSSIKVNQQFKTFILSGTLSQLNLSQWYTIIKAFNFSFRDGDLNNLSGKHLNDASEDLLSDERVGTQTWIDDLFVKSHRSLDDWSNLPRVDTHNPDKLTGQERYLYTYYGTHVLVPHMSSDQLEIPERMFKREAYHIQIDQYSKEKTNIQWFYQFLGDRAITAESETIQRELFGEKQTTHEASLVRTKANLTKEELDILHTVYQITMDSSEYKSPIVARRLQNALLNLNDGLGTKSLYSEINKYAQSNIRFLEYLTRLDTPILKRIQESQLVHQPKLEDTEKFKILQDLIKDKDQTYIIVVNDEVSMRQLAKALGVKPVTKEQLRDATTYQNTFDALLDEQGIAIAPQFMMKSSLDLVKASRLIQYQLNTDLSDMIQVQNRINRIGQTRDTKAYYIATDQLQEALINQFLETYRHIRIAHKGIVELFVDMNQQLNIVNDYFKEAFEAISGQSEKDAGVHLHQVEELFGHLPFAPVATTD